MTVFSVKSHGIHKSELVDMAVTRYLKGGVSFIDMLRFWLWLWLGIERNQYLSHFYDSDLIFLASGNCKENIAASMSCGGNYIYWDEWKLSTDWWIPGYAVCEVSNY